MIKVVLLVVGLLMGPVSHGASLSISDLPWSFFTRILQGEFQVNIVDGQIQSSFETDGFAAYPYFSDNGVGFLLDYDVAAGSSWGTTELSGSVFVRMSMVNDLSTDDHEVDLYFDKLMPEVFDNFFNSGLLYTTLLLEGDAFATGQAVFNRSGDPDYLETGNMSFGPIFGQNAPLLCVECTLDFEFNLLYLDFSFGVLSFNPDDPRTDLIFSQAAFYGTPYGALDINARNVPVPGAFVLLVSAIAGLGGLSRGRKSVGSD